MHGSYRTNGLWAAVGISLGVISVGSMVALFAMIEFDERCMHGLTTGPGRLLRTRDQAFPPATVCEFEGGDVSSAGGHGVLNILLWAAMAVLVACLLVALVAECLEPPLGGPLVEPMTRIAKLRRTGAAFSVLGSLFLGVYALFGWRLLRGPASACSRGADWGSQKPRTLEYTFFPPQFTCQYTSGLTRRMNPEWVASFTIELAVPALLSGIGFALAWRRLREDRRTAPDRSREPQMS